ncbi:beta-lactamase family protein [Paraburkholderia hospita]|uniref:beta-lactamase family protein n=1 Tax=Paraburkholderia hospita TaxID=169430 RepID=UPI00210A9135|nr:beta-lactamase family protein [Paraburkholderia hospita]
MTATGLPGTLVAVVRDLKTVNANGFSTRLVESGQPVDADTVFQLAPLSKPIDTTGRRAPGGNRLGAVRHAGALESALVCSVESNCQRTCDRRRPVLASLGLAPSRRRSAGGHSI